jgi:hypothetical protein
VNYYTATAVGNMVYANPKAFREENVSETYEQYFASPTPLNYRR